MLTRDLRRTDVSIVAYPHVDQVQGESMMRRTIEKEEAHKLIDRLPANATWEDLMHEI